MQITITIPDDTADTCAAPDGVQDPVEFLTAQLQEIATINVGMAQRKKIDLDLATAGIDAPQALPTKTATDLRAMLQNTQQKLLDQLTAKQAEVDQKQATIDAMMTAAKK